MFNKIRHFFRDSIEQARYLHAELNYEYHEFKDQVHFGGDYYMPSFPGLSQAVIRNIAGMK
jgi:hypothetical protein